MDDEFQIEWENNARVKMPRIYFESKHEGYLYPPSRQPLVIHPLVWDKGDEAISYLLVQSLYKYTNDIALIETRVVSQAILAVMSGRLPIVFNAAQKLQLYTVLVDESYHAYAAYDVMLQVQTHTLIEPLLLPKVIEIEHAIELVKEKLDSQYHALFELIAVCIAENTLTKEIVNMLNEEETHPFFKQYLSAHLMDESRHAKIFFHLLRYTWQNISDGAKYKIGRVLPLFLMSYLSSTVQIEFDKQVLMQIGLTPLQAKEAIEDIYGNFKITQHHPLLKNILSFLLRAGVLDKFTSLVFIERGWLTD